MTRTGWREAPSVWIALGILLCCCILALLGVLTPGKLILTEENRVAAELSQPRVSAFFSGTWQQNVERVLEDRFPLRQQCICLERLVEEKLLGQTEIDGILLGKQGWMFTKLTPLAEDGQERLERNLQAVEALGREAAVPVDFLLVPSAALTYPEYLPDFCAGAGSPLLEEAQLLQEIQTRLQDAVNVVELSSRLADNKEQQLYYKTDHHWTTKGAYQGYCAYCTSVGLDPMAIDPEQWVEVPGFYGTHYAKTRLFGAAADVISYYPISGELSVYEVLGEADFVLEATKPMVNKEKLEGNDRYGAFLDGNHGYCVIHGSGQGKLLVVKDSYANCLIPFLTANYEQVGVVDYRNYAYGLDSLIRREGYDRVLILYCVQSFLTDKDIPKMNRPSAQS